jgi:hypothetical protein
MIFMPNIYDIITITLDDKLGEWLFCTQDHVASRPHFPCDTDKGYELFDKFAEATISNNLRTWLGEKHATSELI